MINPMTGVIIAGGQSQRMETDKAFVRIGDKYLIERVFDIITPLFSSILINSNVPDSYERWGFPVVPDLVFNKGALGGIYAALAQAKTQHVFCVACDMPFLNSNLIRYMQEQVDGVDALVPKTPDGLQPLHAIYTKGCIAPIERLFQQDIFKISRLFSEIRVRYITDKEIRRYDPHFESFFNVNTKQELITARTKWREKKTAPTREQPTAFAT